MCMNWGAGRMESLVELRRKLNFSESWTSASCNFAAANATSRTWARFDKSFGWTTATFRKSNLYQSVLSSIRPLLHHMMRFTKSLISECAPRGFAIGLVDPCGIHITLTGEFVALLLVLNTRTCHSLRGRTWSHTPGMLSLYWPGNLIIPSFLPMTFRAQCASSLAHMVQCSIMPGTGKHPCLISSDSSPRRI